MPYKLNDFPISTNQPTVEVELPVGVHSFELIVEDSAGLRSQPKTVTITVTKRQPEITGIDPAMLIRGETIRAKVIGNNLRTITKVEFLHRDAVEPKVQATICGGVTDVEVPIDITLQTDAPIGEYGLKVTPSSDVADRKNLLRVVAKPEIRKFAPQSLGLDEKARMVISGAHLRMDGVADKDFLKGHKVEFAGANDKKSEPMPIAELKPGECQADKLVLVVSVGPTVKLGKYRLQVTTPAGTVTAQPEFEVTKQ